MAQLPSAPQPTVAAIYAAYERAQDNERREHLGASQIGHPCERALFYSFRWATRVRHDGRMLRLFETGDLEEARFVANLRAAGVIVSEVDPDTGKQWVVRDESGHFGGSMDGKALGLPEAPKTIHVLEFKTHNTKNFAKLLSQGVRRAKPLHYAQMQSYMHLIGLTRAFYLARNKDTDELHSERVNYDPEFAVRLVAKAQRIINSPHAPDRISNDPSWFECRYCDHRAVCWEGAMPERHCRACLHSTPVQGGKWTCAKHGTELSKAKQEAGCPSHLYIPDLVPGEQIDATEQSVTYRMTDGSIWTDGNAT